MSNSSAVKKNLLILHFTVLIWGFTGILGALISIDAVQLVWFRVMIASLTLLGYFKLSRTSIKVSKRQFLAFFFTGSIVAIHWILFFHAIKISTVSVVLVCMSSVTLFTAILEPIIKKQAILGTDILVGILIICGIYLIFKFESQHTLGIVLGLISAFCAALFATINSTLVQKSDPKIIGFYEITGAFFWVSIYRISTGEMTIAQFDLSTTDWIYLFILGTICTALAYVAGVSVMRTLSAFRVALITNLEPVYGILLAFLFFGKREAMSLGFYLGATIILGAVFLYPVYKKRKNLQ